MQMVAASKMRKAQQSTLKTRPFARLLYRIQRYATTHAREFTHPLLEVRAVRKRAVILIGTDKGLCGALNTNLFRVAAQFDPATPYHCGRQARGAVCQRGPTGSWRPEFAFGDSPAIRLKPGRLPTLLVDLFLKGEVDEVKVVATRFINTLSQKAGVVEFADCEIKD
jgi:F-type H+-transporting ATPase subunit gamma